MAVTLKFGDKVTVADVRKLQDMEDVVFDREWFEKIYERNRDMYYMFRDLAKNDVDHGVIESHHLRYDITRIPPGMLGSEYVKTVGHYHPLVPGTDVSYPELYQVLDGSATYVLQKAKPGEEDIVLDVAVIKAEKGDLVLVPPGYGHVTINASEKTLEMANWVCREFSSVYEPIKRLSGAAYFLLKDGFAKNPLYRDIPPIRYLKPLGFDEIGLAFGENMYDLVHRAEKLRFLSAPQDYMGFLSGVL
ncbi:Glucose-6-phosphate isomerase [Methanosarcina siciliae C2J]|uniref:glucose-6-phosphate isomerase n=2 Tax=Methanosarcina siciliae TaxID=38027 RepID=A0A0E3P218_9EURY|nr:glucose-6-phosphate isomerase family protein [Methanosarcina siciliae]AKB27450.1 Glucose-6-phosphate isomerase [Methanosarcina siciliae T4/M]AKB35349.1 Glucose-6-phosphate isomerase [Methanosarcina siciliae C2J]